MKPIFRLIILTLIIVSTIIPAKANINITGKILDSNNKIIPNATVHINYLDNNMTASTDAKGIYTLEISSNLNFSIVSASKDSISSISFCLSLLSNGKYNIDIKIAGDKSTISCKTFDINYLNECYKKIEQLKNENKKSKNTDKLAIENKKKLCNLITSLIREASDFENLSYLAAEYFDAIGDKNELIPMEIDSNIVLDMIGEIPINSNLYNDTNIFYAILAESMFKDESAFDNNKINLYLSQDSKKDNSKFIELLANYATKIKDTKNAEKYIDMLKKQYPAYKPNLLKKN